MLMVVTQRLPLVAFAKLLGRTLLSRGRTIMQINSDLVALGKNLSRARLTHQGRVFAGLALAYSAQLATVGWTAQDTAEFSVLIEKIELAVTTQSKAKEDARLSAVAVEKAVEEAQLFLRKLRTTLPTALRTLPKGDGARAMFKATQPLGDSQARIGAYLTQIRPGIERLESVLTPLFQGVSPLTFLDAAKAKLDAAAAPHGVARRRLPETTKSLNEAKGRLMVKLRDLHQRAKIVFDSRPDVAAQFALEKSVGTKATTSNTSPPTKPTDSANTQGTVINPVETGKSGPDKSGTITASGSNTSAGNGDNSSTPSRFIERPTDKQATDKTTTALVTTGRTEPVGPVPQ